MKLTVSTLTCPDWSLEQVVDACARYGIAGVDFRGLGSEIDLTRTPAFTTDLEQTLALFAARGLQIPCLNTSVTLVSPGPERWQDMLNEAFRYAQLAEKTRTPYLRIFGGAVLKGLDDDEALAMAQRHLRQVVKICKPRGTRPIVETHDVWATGPAMRRLLHEFDPADVGVLWDVEHPYRAGEVPSDTAESIGRWVRHVHIKDSRAQVGRSAPTLVGEGDLPLADLVRTLRAMNYDGWLCLETERRWRPDETPLPEQSIPRFAEHVRALTA